MTKKDREIYKVPRHYIVPLAAGIAIAVAGIIMTFLNHHGYGKSEEYTQPLEITGPQAIILGSVILFFSLYYRRKLSKETEELNRRQ